MDSITTQSTPLTLTVTIAPSARRLAEEFAKQQTNSKKAKQVYFNTLAVWTVDFYLQCLGIETALEAGDSWHPLKRALRDVADLEVKDYGKLECIPVLPSSEIMEISLDVFENRIGYVAVRISESLREATLLGFVKRATEELSIAQLQPLEDLLAHIKLRQSETDNKLVHLSQWFEGIIDSAWMSVEELLGIKEAKLAYRFRTNSVRRGKPIELGSPGDIEPVALIVGVRPTVEPEIYIWVEVHPVGKSTYLPSKLQLMVLDEGGTTVMEAKAKSTNNFQVELTGYPGERFSVKLDLDNVSIIEDFLI